MSESLDQLCINTIRMLSVDAVEKAKSGHPGAPMGLAPVAYTLWTRFLKHNPRNPSWPDRDRFVLSAGHGSMLLYSMLHLTGYDLPLEEIQRFRQWESRTPGHPERGMTPGVETTTGPLGQGFGNGVGMAIAEAYLAARYNRPGFEIVDHFTYGIVSDGDLMEGVAAEAASIAGHLKLGKLIYLYDNNHISLAASTDLTFTEDCAKRFDAYGWHTLTVEDGNDVAAIDGALRAARNETARPSLDSGAHPHRLRIAGEAGHFRSPRIAAGRRGSEADQAKTRLAGGTAVLSSAGGAGLFSRIRRQGSTGRGGMAGEILGLCAKLSRAGQGTGASPARRAAPGLGRGDSGFPGRRQRSGYPHRIGENSQRHRAQAADIDRRLGGFESIDIYGAGEAGRF